MANTVANARPSGRINYLDLAKGIAIIMVVWVHAQGPLDHYFCQPVVPLFFLISGLLYKKEVPLKKFVIRRIQGLYIPYVFWNVVIHTFAALKQGDTIEKVLKYDINIFLLRYKDGQFLGASWFLASLFIISVLYKVVDTLVKEGEYKDIFMLFIFGTLAMIAFGENLPYTMSRTFILGFFYPLGVFTAKHKNKLAGLDGCGTAVISILLFIWITYYESPNFAKNTYVHPLLFMIASAFFCYAMLYWCRWLDSLHGRVFSCSNKVLLVLGSRSLDIMLFHFIAFRFVIIIQMLLHHEAISPYNILQYYPVYSPEGLWWLAYVLVGLVGPLLFGAFLRMKPWGGLVKKLHII